MALIHSPRQGLTDIDGVFHSPRQGLTTLAEFHSPRQGLTDLSAVLHSPRQGVTSIWGETFANQVVALEGVTLADWEDACRNIWVPPSVTCSYAGLDMTPLLGDFTIKEPLDGKTTLDVDFNNPVDSHNIEIKPSDIVPPGYGDYDDIIRQHDGTTARVFQFQITSFDQPWTSEIYMPQPVAYDSLLKWGGDDLTARLDQDISLFGTPPVDIIRGSGDLVYAHFAAQQLGALAGVQVICNFPNYLLGEFRRGSGSLLGILDNLAAPMKAKRRTENGCLVYEQVNAAAPPQWRFVGQLNAKCKGIAEVQRQVNSFVLARFTPAGGFIGEASGTTLEGRKPVSFTPSRHVVIDTIKATMGNLVDWVFFSESGTILAGGGGGGVAYYNGAIPAARAECTYLPSPNPNNYVWTPAWEVVARGTNMPRETNYRFAGSVAELIAIYGEVKDGKAQMDAIIGDEAGAQLSLAASISECRRTGWKAVLELPYLNPHIKAGHTAAFKHARTRQDWTNWVIEDVTKSRKGRHGEMTLDLTRGEL